MFNFEPETTEEPTTPIAVPTADIFHQDTALALKGKATTNFALWMPTTLFPEGTPKEKRRFPVSPAMVQHMAKSAVACYVGPRDPEDEANDGKHSMLSIRAPRSDYERDITTTDAAIAALTLAGQRDATFLQAAKHNTWDLQAFGTKMVAELRKIATGHGYEAEVVTATLKSLNRNAIRALVTRHANDQENEPSSLDGEHILECRQTLVAIADKCVPQYMSDVRRQRFASINLGIVMLFDKPFADGVAGQIRRVHITMENAIALLWGKRIELRDTVVLYPQFTAEDQKGEVVRGTWAKIDPTNKARIAGNKLGIGVNYATTALRSVRNPKTGVLRPDVATPSYSGPWLAQNAGIVLIAPDAKDGNGFLYLSDIAQLVCGRELTPLAVSNRRQRRSPAQETVVGSVFAGAAAVQF